MVTSPFGRLRNVALAALLGVAAAVTQPAAAEIPPDDQAVVEQAVSYLEGIATLKSDFIQVTDDGGYAEGTLWLSRPGRMRLEYDDPIENFVVADGLFIYFWDAELEQQTNAPLRSTLAGLILRRDLDLGDEVTVTGVRREAGRLEISLRKADEPDLGELTLVFGEQPLRLRGWRVLDAAGVTTEVAMVDPQVGVELDRNLFYFIDPARNATQQ